MTRPTGQRLSFAQHTHFFLLALSFLTRLAPARIGTEAELARSTIYYPVAGLVLGAVLTTPFFLGLFSNTPFLQAWWYVAAGAYLTRGLHYDGLADICDALGSGPARFHAVLKDSRLGAFGALGLCIAISGMLCGVYALCLSGQYVVLLLLPCWSRSLPAVLATLSFPHPDATLGRILFLHPQKQAALTGACFFMLSALWATGGNATLLCLMVTSGCVLFTRSLATQYGGYNGDLFGMLIVLAEVAIPVILAA
ncbi:adenosylcobinamide-GDP ribazoletransferase [Desulfovibrio cuneatus]|uniref:adenosylcobinamide-GDP ribazoletransferase n=1 Tax=Desulfovibrio cuneatus TaxID=159728 RepID=UPI00042841F1|nr:adenosylcobinamide-GDP ribazoletransferase [Desulfovibrio cuneatus]